MLKPDSLWSIFCIGENKGGEEERGDEDEGEDFDQLGKGRGLVEKGGEEEDEESNWERGHHCDYDVS